MADGLAPRSGRRRPLEGVPQDRDLRPGSVAEDRDDIEPAWHFSETLSLEICLGRSKNPPLFFACDRFRRMTERRPTATLDLDEAERPRLFRDEINFADARHEVPFEDFVAGGLQVALGETLPLLPAATETLVVASALEDSDEAIEEKAGKHGEV
jgi:hypothetical protein